MKFLIPLFMVIAANCAFAQLAAWNGSVPASNFRIYPSSVTQTEVFVVQHPANPSLLFSSANTINLSSGFKSEGIYVSEDAGATWNGSDTCAGAPINFHLGDPGIAIDLNGRFILTRLGFQDGLFAHYSTDNGKSWSSQRTVASEQQDRASLLCDLNSGSVSFDKTFTAYVEFLPPFPLKFSVTSDGGASWSAPRQINAPSQRCQGAELVLGVDSIIHLVWAGVQSVSPYTEDVIGTAKTTDGGVTWLVNEQAIDINGIQGSLPQKSSIRVNGLPKGDVDRTNGTRRGWFYIVTTQKNLAPAGSDPDVILYRSMDGGTTWSQGIRVNQDPVNNGKIQYFPAIHVDELGGVNVIYYDDRNTTGDSAGVFLSRSTDGGTTWSDFRVSDHHFRPQSIGGLGQGYQGDNIALTSTNGKLIPLWMDNASGIYQIWSSRIPISSLVSVPTVPSIPDRFVLAQNFPNPFNPSTTISFTLPTACHVTVTVFDQLGREVSVLLNEEKSAGEHRIEYLAEPGLSSGVYFYRVSAGVDRFTGKMILQK
jgi:hypothetical protein